MTQDPRPAPPPATLGPSTQRLRLGIIGFYLSCAGVAIGATVGSAGFLWFESTAALVCGCVMVLVCSFTCYRSLHFARR